MYWLTFGLKKIVRVLLRVWAISIAAQNGCVSGHFGSLWRRLWGTNARVTKRSTDFTHVELVLWVYSSTIATETPDKYPFGMLFSSTISTGFFPLVLEDVCYIFTADQWRAFDTKHLRKFSENITSVYLEFASLSEKILGFKLVISNLMNDLSKFIDRQVEVYGKLDGCSQFRSSSSK